MAEEEEEESVLVYMCTGVENSPAASHPTTLEEHLEVGSRYLCAAGGEGVLGYLPASSCC